MNMNFIDFSLMDEQKKDYPYTVLVVLTRGFNEEMLKHIWSRANYVICLGHAIKRIQNTQLIPNCIIGNLETINELDFYHQRNTKMILNTKNEKSDMEKAIWLSLELLAEQGEYSVEYEIKKHCMIILGRPSDRIDEILLSYLTIYKYLSGYLDTFQAMDLFIICKSAMCTYLRQGTSIIYPCRTLKREESQYSIIALDEEAEITVYEGESIDGEMICVGSQKLKFGGSFYSALKPNPQKLKIEIDSKKESVLLYFSTSKYNK